MHFDRGATYNLPVKLLLKKQPLSLDDVQKIEFSFNGDIIKTYPQDDSITREEDKLIIFLSTSDTLAFNVNKQARLQARIVFDDKDIKFSKVSSYSVSDTQFTKVEGVEMNDL